MMTRHAVNACAEMAGLRRGFIENTIQKTKNQGYGPDRCGPAGAETRRLNSTERRNGAT
jgi:hypothetical protein